ncbi:aldo/keto reductase [Natrialbaceae archaeon A-gly3]
MQDPIVTAGGAEIPALGFGTARMTGHECQRAVEDALEVGYRHVDTAQMYDNEEAVGATLESADVSREEVFVVTKIHSSNLASEDAKESTYASLERLGLETVDLLLIHAPNSNVPLEETIEAMNELQREGAVEHIGVSNFSIQQLESAIALSETPIVTNQVKYHPYHDQGDLLEFCIDEDVCLTAYSPLAEGTVIGDERLEVIGESHDASAPQVALAWLLAQPNVAAIPKASSRRHIEENYGALEVELTDEELREVFEVRDGLLGSLSRRLGL